MSRFDDYGDGEESFPNQGAMWSNAAHLALRGRRGKAALRELREALMSLPEHRLIDSALCTVGVQDRLASAPKTKVKAGMFAAVWEGPPDVRPLAWPGYDYFQGPYIVPNDAIDELAHVAQSIEAGYLDVGVCAVGAMAWYRQVKDGVDPDEAFRSLPVMADEDGDAGHATANYARDRLGLAYTLAWELAYRNDELLGSVTPEQRWQRFVDWIDQELATPTPARPPRRVRRPRRAPSSPQPASMEIGL